MEDLKRLGLSPYEIKIYTSLLQYGRMSAREIADKSGVPPTAVYPNLKRLVSRNFVQELSGELSYFEPVDPAVVIPAFIQNKKKSLDELEIALVEQTKILFYQKQQLSTGIRTCPALSGAGWKCGLTNLLWDGGYHHKGRQYACDQCRCIGQQNNTGRDTPSFSIRCNC